MVVHVKLNVADLVEAEEIDQLVEVRQRVPFAGDVGHRAAEREIGPVPHGHFRQRDALGSDGKCLQERDGGPRGRDIRPAAAEGAIADFKRILFIVQRGVDNKLDVAGRGGRISRGQAEAANAVDFAGEDFGQRAKPGVGGHDPRLGGKREPSRFEFQGFRQRDEIQFVRGGAACGDEA